MAVKIQRVEMYEVRTPDGATVLRTKTLEHAKAFCREKGETYRVSKGLSEVAQPST